ncbi:acyl-CoA dehydrogenase [Acrasis kona]|uniref:Acyl-CoA dehydrogenase n=1 Tax=Acrasis kona TaxID=1008807 RepID=A0AAW2ZB12_9EUKA
MSHAPYTDSWNQEPPRIYNPYLTDTSLLDILHTKLSKEIREKVNDDLVRFGKRCITEIKNLGDQAENHHPKLHHFDAWQRRVDEIETSTAWKRLNDISAEEGLVSTGFNRKVLVKISLSRSNLNCRKPTKDLPAQIPKYFWTSGQWMTEKRGGSDVSLATRTVAFPNKNQDFNTDHELNGVKFFTSATDSQMTFTLARIVPDRKDINEKELDKIPLSLFFVKMRDEATNQLNGIQIHKLKQKLGTKALPTAELSLVNTKALLVGQPGRGISNISYMLNITRLYNSISAVSRMRRVVNIARDYAQRRIAFGRTLSELPLHARTLSELECEVRGCLHLVMDQVDRMGRLEHAELNNKSIDPIEATLLRLLIPVTKLYTAKKCVAVVSEGLECLGGQGYIEDTGVPVYLRDSQVLSIWEGTTNVLSMDVLRVLQKQPDAIQTFLQRVVQNCKVNQKKLSEQDELRVKYCTKNILSSVDQLKSDLLYASKQKLIELCSRQLSMSIAHIYIASLLLVHCGENKSDRTDVSADVQCLYQYVTMHAPLCKIVGPAVSGETLSDIVSRERLLVSDSNGSGRFGSKVDEVIFTPYGIKSRM